VDIPERANALNSAPAAVPLSDRQELWVKSAGKSSWWGIVGTFYHYDVYFD